MKKQWAERLKERNLKAYTIDLPVELADLCMRKRKEEGIPMSYQIRKGLEMYHGVVK